MAEVDINDLGLIGAVRDTPGYMLPPEAFTTALNMCIRNGGIERLLGWAQIFGTPPVAPHFAMPVRTPAATFWLYVSLAKAYTFDGTNHVNITRQTTGVDVDYTASATEQWNGTLLGGVPIVNNGVDIPQFWATISGGTKLQNLTNWPTTLRAKVLRQFGPFLVASGIAKSGTQLPHTVKWSHPADPGSIPVSWDETDPTKDAGETDLPDVNSGLLTEMLQLSDTMYHFKENSVWKQRFIGGRDIFDFGKGAWLTTTGILAPRCVAITNDGSRQVWASQDDILWHDGNQVKSVLDARQRLRLLNEIDTATYGTSFMFDNPQQSEMYFCYPGSGQAQPDRALLMKYGKDPWVVTEVDGITFRNAASGQLQSPNEELWSDGTDTWADDTGPWSEIQRRRLVLCAPASTKFLNLDSGPTRDTVVFTGLLQRLGLAVLGKKRTGEWIVDFNRKKMVDDMWPKIQGNPVSIRLGYQDLVDGPVTWNAAVLYTPGTDIVAYAGPVSGRCIAIEFSAAASWRIDGYKMYVADLGPF